MSIKSYQLHGDRQKSMQLYVQLGSVHIAPRKDIGIRIVQILPGQLDQQQLIQLPQKTMKGGLYQKILRKILLTVSTRETSEPWAKSGPEC